MRTLLRWLLLGLLTVLAVPSRGAEIGCLIDFEAYSGKRICQTGYLKGEIVKGDYNRLKSFYRDNYPGPFDFALQSPGGDVEEAIKIGRLFRKYSITAIAPNNNEEVRRLLPDFQNSSILCQGQDCICASSCALTWFGAPLRSGDVGLHRPIFRGPGFKDLTPGEAERAYKPVLALIAQYLEEMEVPKAYTEAMVATSSADIRWTSPNDHDLLDRSPSFAEWLQANCGQYGSHLEDKDITVLHTKQSLSKLTKAETQQLALFTQRWQQRNKCEADLISNNRAKLPPPSVDVEPEESFDPAPDKNAKKNESRLVVPPVQNSPMPAPR